jgi:ethanolamine utilization protein EutN
MRLGHVIGKVTLSRQDPSYRGGSLLVVQPLSAAQFADPAARGPAGGASLVVYDRLGAGPGHILGFTEGSEAAMPFSEPTPVDAYSAALIDEIFYRPPR